MPVFRAFLFRVTLRKARFLAVIHTEKSAFLAVKHREKPRRQAKTRPRRTRQAPPPKTQEGKALSLRRRNFFPKFFYPFPKFFFSLDSIYRKKALFLTKILVSLRRIWKYLSDVSFLRYLEVIFERPLAYCKKRSLKRNRIA